MRTLRLTYPLPLLCSVLGVSRSGYYAWRTRTPSRRTREEERLAVEIKAAHARTRGTYGPERLQRDLATYGITMGICRIRRKLGICCKQKRRFKATTDSCHTLPVAPHLLDRNFDAASPNQVWVSDITYIATGEGWLYCAAHKDLFNGEIVGYASGPQITADIVAKSLCMAVARKRPREGLIHHSDRGRQQAIGEVTEYIEVFYNRQRRQARLGYLSPVAYEQRYYAKRRVA